MRKRLSAWLARQSWSNGNVGMLGISWGGFNSIQMALRKPPAFKAILAVDATDELFKEDVHYMDGIFHVDEFELTMDLDQGRTGAPDYSLEESAIGPRMNSTPWSLTYLKHQRDGIFWRSPLRPIDTLQGTRIFDRRPAGWLSRQHSPNAREGESPSKGLDRTVESRFPERQRLWSAVRMARPGGALVRLLAQRPRYRRAVRSQADRLSAALASAGIAISRRARRMARREFLAAGRRHYHDAVFPIGTSARL